MSRYKKPKIYITNLWQACLIFAFAFWLVFFAFLGAFQDWNYRQFTNYLLGIVTIGLVVVLFVLLADFSLDWLFEKIDQLFEKYARRK